MSNCFIVINADDCVNLRKQLEPFKDFDTTNFGKLVNNE